MHNDQAQPRRASGVGWSDRLDLDCTFGSIADLLGGFLTRAHHSMQLIVITPVRGPKVCGNYRLEVDNTTRMDRLEVLQAFNSLLQILDSARFRGESCWSLDPVPPTSPTLRLVALPARWDKVCDFRDIACRALFGDDGFEMVPFGCRITAVCASDVRHIHIEHP